MSYRDVSTFVVKLQSQEGIAARALEFLILTATRAGEALGARWEEFDLEHAVWTVPPIRMKAGREHRVPLSLRALEIVKEIREVRCEDFVFPGRKPGKSSSGRSVLNVLRRMKIEGATVHGFRSTFRDWTAECTNFSNEVCEAALAHAIENRTEAAYRRGDLFEKRRRLMAQWATFCTTASIQGNVTPLRRKSLPTPITL
jgi:integrase